ncbi:autotransporter outer membrane beta-barrel domain-containing protein [Bartonella grahamii]|uniref:autotransporter outer membrane beta-barrel domain-containing protein n=1 Tax=Bartonella grahamii TaxID=33045 RepID=UPI001ABA0ED3|nr:autotransporter outer membrane beta-barrel domain-containing protein [Bartonella grahamii]
MYKKSLLSYTATVAIILSSIYSNAHAESLEASGEGPAVTGETGKSYEILHAKESGKITGENLTVTGNKDTGEGSSTSSPGSSSLESPAAVTAEGENSMITLTGNKTTIKGTDFNINLGLEAKNNGIIKITGGTVNAKEMALFSGNGGHIIVENVVLTAEDDEGLGVVVASGDKSTIELQGNTKIENAVVGLTANNDSTIKMTGGSITASGGGAAFLNSKGDANELNGVTISSHNEVPLLFGISANKSMVTLKNVTVTQAEIGIFANDSKLEVFGGEFNGKNQGVYALNGGTVILNKGEKDGATITSTDGTGLVTEGKNSTIKMTGGIVTGNQAALSATQGGHIEVEDVTLKATGDKGIAAGASNSDSIIKLGGNTTVESTFFGLGAANGGNVEMTGGTVTGNQAALSAFNSGYIEVTDVSLKTNSKGVGAQSTGPNSTIELHGNTIVDDAVIGLFAQDGGAIKMSGGSITVSTTGKSTVGANFSNNSKGNELENVTISKKEGDTSSLLGISAIDNSQVTLKNVTVQQAKKAIFASNSEINVFGGTFETENDTVYALNGGSITLAKNGNDGTTIISTDGNGLHAEGENSIIKMTDGTVTTKNYALFAEDKAHIEVENVTLKTTGDKEGAGAIAIGDDSVIKLHGNTTVDNAIIGLLAQDNGAIKMTGGSITASKIGAYFENTESEKNKLEGVTISSGKNDAPLIAGIEADKNSTVALKDVTVTQATSAIIANDHSTITVSGGSFEAKGITIGAANGSTITLTNEAQITSSEDYGLYAEESGSTITMTKGNVTGKGVTLAAENGGHITATDVTLKTTDDGIGADADGSKSVIELENTTISDSAIGLHAQSNGAISMTGGSIKASVAGAVFSKSEREENYLDNVIISSGEGGALLGYGIEAEEKSKVTLKNVTISDAINAVAAYDNSTIKISGGSFKAEDETIYVADGGTINLDDAAQITSSNSYGLHADGLNSTITMNEGHVKGDRTALSAEDGGHITVTGVTITTEKQLSGLGASVINSNSMIELRGTDIIDTSTGLLAQDGGVIKMNKGTITTSTVGAIISNSKSNENKLEDVTISSNGKGNSIIFTGLNAQASNITLENVHITQAFTGVMAMDHSQITISGGSFAGNNVGIRAESGSTITLAENAQITSSNGYALHATGLDSTITMMTGSITGTEAALAVENGGHIDATNISATAEKNGIKFENPEEDTTSEVNLTNAKIHIKNGTGINVDESTGTINLGKKSEIRGDVLLVNKDSTKGNNFTFTLNSDDSILEGRAKIINSPKTIFNLQNNTQWIVKTSTKEKGEDGQLIDIAQRSRSDVSTLNLDNSSIIFSEPTEEHYHTLHIGSGKPDTQEVYKASGDAKIYFNIAWSDGVASADQKTDRLLIHGDVSGNTTVYIKSDSGDKNSVVNAADPSNIGGLSLIQVSGKAQEDSFKLANGYTTRGRLPYKYTLTAYGPDSSHGQADIAQNMFDEKNENFWDFRLHKEILETGSGSGVDTLVPQTASYLVMPNALFHAGLTDIAKQDEFLANMRISTIGQEQGIKNAFFLYTYGSTGTLSSERGPLKYGYGADIRYAALQAGVTLAAIEGQNTTTHLGLVGTYGQLSFTPKDMSDAGKNTLDKWSLTAYGSIQHNSGFYIDALLSYGILKGHIANAIRGNTAKLNDAKMLSISTTVGKEFATNMEGLTFEPQAQVAYQHLMFNTIEDADNFTVDMNNPSQWLIRVGGRLTKTISTENNRPMSFYGKVNLIKTFGDDGTIHIGRDFDLDPMGPAIEGGIGINAQLSHNFSLHGDVSYQQKLQKTGISGANFSGGIRYQF